MKNILVNVMRFTKLYPTRFVKEKLETEGIECVLTDEGFRSEPGELPYGWNLQVRAKDVEKTVKIILKIQSELGLENIEELNTLKDLKKILVPVDLSNYSMEAVKYAFGLATKIQAEIKFLYVLPEPHLPGTVKYTTSWQAHEKIERDELFKNAQKMLLEFSEEIKHHIPEEQRKATRFHFAIHTGSLGNVVVSLSYRYKPDFVLMHHKDKPEEKTYLSKVVEYITKYSEYPVMILPKSASYSNIDKLTVMYATNFHDNDHTSLNTLLEILKPFDTRIHCIHIETEYPLDSNEKLEELNKFLKDEYKDQNITADLIESSNVSLGIEEFINQKHIGLIAMSTQKHNFIYRIFHADVVKEMIKASKVPMLVFPVKGS